MSDLVRRLNATLRTDAINGDSFERSVVESQVAEAVRYIEELERQVARQAISTEEGGGSSDSAVEKIRQASDDLLNDEMSDLDHGHMRSRLWHFVKTVRAILAGLAEDFSTPPIQQQGRADSSLGEQKQDE